MSWPLLVSCRRRDGSYPQATVKNAEQILKQILLRLRKPTFTFELWQVRFARRRSRLDFVSIYATDDPQLVPQDLKFVVGWSSGRGWGQVSQEVYEFICDI